MYSDKIYLTPQEILDKEFKVDARGYRPQEVDKYLDMVIRDYTEFISIIKNKEKDNLKHEKEQIENLKESYKLGKEYYKNVEKKIKNK